MRQYKDEKMSEKFFGSIFFQTLNFSRNNIFLVRERERERERETERDKKKALFCHKQYSSFYQWFTWNKCNSFWKVLLEIMKLKIGSFVFVLILLKFHFFQFLKKTIGKRIHFTKLLNWEQFSFWYNCPCIFSITFRVDIELDSRIGQGKLSLQLLFNPSFSAGLNSNWRNLSGLFLSRKSDLCDTIRFSRSRGIG